MLAAQGIQFRQFGFGSFERVLRRGERLGQFLHFHLLL